MKISNQSLTQALLAQKSAQDKQVSANTTAQYASYILTQAFSMAAQMSYSLPQQTSTSAATSNDKKTSSEPVNDTVGAPSVDTMDQKRDKIIDLLKEKVPNINKDSEFIDDLVSKYDLYTKVHPDWDDTKKGERLYLYLKALEGHKVQLSWNDEPKSVSDIRFNEDKDIKSAKSNLENNRTDDNMKAYLSSIKDRGLGELDLYDTDGDGKISLDEFCALEKKDMESTIKESSFSSSEKAATEVYFNIMDKNGDNYLDADEMASHWFASARIFDNDKNTNTADDITEVEWLASQDVFTDSALEKFSDPVQAEAFKKEAISTLNKIKEEFKTGKSSQTLENQTIFKKDSLSMLMMTGSMFYGAIK